MKLEQPGRAGESPLGKEDQRASSNRCAHDASGIRCAPAAIESLDELRSQPAQEQSGEGNGSHLPLDHKPETGGKRRGVYDAVEIARVVGDNHTLSRRQMSERPNREAHAHKLEEAAGDEPGDAPTPFDAGQHDSCQQCKRCQCHEHQRGIEAVRESQGKESHPQRSRQERMTRLASHWTDINQYLIVGM